MTFPNVRYEERIHIFRPEFPGKYLHYSKPIGDRYGMLERVEEARYYTLTEVQSWIFQHDPGPIGQDEIERLKRGIMTNPDDLDAKRGIFRSDETAEEPTYNPPPKKPEPENKPSPGDHLMTQCPDCGAWVWPMYLSTHRQNYHSSED